MSIAIYAAVCIVVLWAVLALVLSRFVRGMVVVAIGVALVYYAVANNCPVWVVLAGVLIILFPMATWFKRTIFGE